MSSVYQGGPPRQRGSIRNVTIEGDPRTYMCEVRALPGRGLREGDRCWVEFGAYWVELPGKKIRHAGQWRECQVLRGPAGTSADVHVRPAPLLQGLEQNPCRCNEGWVCEDHFDKPRNHDGCEGAGTKCDNPSCPWWQGTIPAALDLQAERRKPS